MVEKCDCAELSTTGDSEALTEGIAEIRSSVKTSLRVKKR
jgi:hypothetical protein